MLHFKIRDSLALRLFKSKMKKKGKFSFVDQRDVLCKRHNYFKRPRYFPFNFSLQLSHISREKE